MRCPKCGHPESKVLDSRPTEEGTVVRRRRECLGCAERFTTYEKVEAAPLMVIKKDGRREQFSGQKVLHGLLTACEKRPVPLARLEQVVAEIEGELRSRLEKEVATSDIGELVMDRLREIDDVAYVRFASVYRQFRDLETFHREVEHLLSGKAGDARGGKYGEITPTPDSRC